MAEQRDGWNIKISAATVWAESDSLLIRAYATFSRAHRSEIIYARNKTLPDLLNPI